MIADGVRGEQRPHLVLSFLLRSREPDLFQISHDPPKSSDRRISSPTHPPQNSSCIHDDRTRIQAHHENIIFLYIQRTKCPKSIVRKLGHNSQPPAIGQFKDDALEDPDHDPQDQERNFECPFSR